MNTQNKLENINMDKRISIAISSIFITLMGQYFVLIVFNLLDSSKGSIVQLTSKMLVALAFCYALPSVLKKSKLKFIILYFISIFIILVNMLLFSENIEYIKEILFPMFFMCIPSYIYISSIKDIKIFERYIRISSNIICIMGTIISIMVFTGNVFIGPYSMSLSYYMLFPAIIYISNTIENRKFSDFICFIISLVSIISLGSRGALMCIISFIVLKLIKIRKKYTFKEITFVTIVILSIIPCIISYKNIIIFIRDAFYKLGIQSRTIELILREDIYLSGRDSIYNELLRELYEKPILGLGIGADRKIESGYAHNIFIEILCNYGSIIGLIIIISLIIIIIRSLIVSNGNDYNVVIFWISVGFIHLLVSGSYLIEIKFWIMLGIITRKFKKI
ncbi:O-antigen ligase family protein [Paraclostridium bifermentans]|uniref:O-antigen ligase family protein n=1 Tax=Paraclostridium bifermentans TaxID=1490 RepID=UPI00359C8716